MADTDAENSGPKSVQDLPTSAQEARQWLDDLERESVALEDLRVVRLARVGLFRRQALASLLDEDTGDDAEKAASVSLLLAQEEILDRREEFIVMLRRVLPLALSVAGDVEDPPEEQASAVHELEALLLYGRWMEQRKTEPFDPEPAEDISPQQERETDTGKDEQKEDEEYSALLKALELAPDQILLRLAAAEELMKQDRPQAVLDLLGTLPSPLPEQKLSLPSGFEDGTSTVWLAAWKTGDVDRRLRVRGLYLRALALLRSRSPTLADRDLEEALQLAPHRAELWIARGAVHQLRSQWQAMCQDYHRACSLGLCGALFTARQDGYCLPEMPDRTSEAEEPRLK